MLKPFPKRLLILTVLLSALTGFGLFSPSEVQAFDTCNNYYNSSIAFHYPYGWACSYTGPGCQECVLLRPMGYTVCLESGSRSLCYDYQY